MEIKRAKERKRIRETEWKVKKDTQRSSVAHKKAKRTIRRKERRENVKERTRYYQIKRGNE
jgi:hypothetical protein